MKILNKVPFLKIGIVLLVMPVSHAFAIEPNQVYLAQASAWQCRLTWASGGTTLGSGGTKDTALQDLNRQVSLDRVNNNGQNYSVGTTCYTLPVPGGASSNPSTGSNSSPRPQPRVGDQVDYEERTRQLYRQILGREPDPSGFRDNVNAMRQHGFEWVRAGMSGSQESRNNINNLYRQYLCRDADPGGMDFHINLLASGQMALDQIRNGIANGAEAQQHKNGCR